MTDGPRSPTGASESPSQKPAPPEALLARAAGSPVAVLGAYALLAAAITFPLATDPAGLLAGGARSDAANSVWGLWFVHRALVAGRLPLATELLEHPHGGRIAVADPLNALLGLPLVAGFGPVAAYGLLVLAHLTFAGVAAHVLGRRLGGSGWIAGVGYLLAPIVLSHVQNGSSETIGAGWLPLGMLAVVDAAERGGIGRSARAGLALAVCAIGGWYAGIGAFLFACAVAVLGWRAAPAREPAPRPHPFAARTREAPSPALRNPPCRNPIRAPRRWRARSGFSGPAGGPRVRPSASEREIRGPTAFEIPIRATLVRVGTAILLGVALVAPFATAVRAVAEAPDGLVDIKNPADLARIRRTLGAADPRSFVTPGDFRSPDFARDEANPSDRVHTTYLGFVLLGLAFWPARRTGAGPRPDGAPVALLVAFGAGIVLAMGPVVVANGYPLAMTGRALPLPYALLEGLPGFDALSLLYRLSTVSALSLALLADRRVPSAPRAAGWAALVAAEVLWFSPARGLPAVTPVPDLPAIEALAAAPPGAVVNLPVQAGRNFLYEQVLHGKPVCGSLNAGLNRAGLRVLYEARRLRAGDIDRDAFVAAARQEGVRYVVLHTNLLMAETFVGSTTGIRRAFATLAEDERTVVYQLW